MILVIQRYYLMVALAALAGCAADPVPTEQMRLTEQAVQQARAVGATEAQAEFQQALAKQLRATKNLQEQDYKRARVLAEEAELDARLAEVKLLREKSEGQLQGLQVGIKRLKQKLGEVR
jgi:hypothetical protein